MKIGKKLFKHLLVIFAANFIMIISAGTVAEVIIKSNNPKFILDPVIVKILSVALFCSLITTPMVFFMIRLFDPSKEDEKTKNNII